MPTKRKTKITQADDGENQIAVNPADPLLPVEAPMTAPFSDGGLVMTDEGFIDLEPKHLMHKSETVLPTDAANKLRDRYEVSDLQIEKMVKAEIDANRVGPDHPDYHIIGAHWAKSGRPSTFTYQGVQRYQQIRDNEGIIFLKIGGTLKDSANYGDVSL